MPVESKAPFAVSKHDVGAGVGSAELGSGVGFIVDVGGALIEGDDVGWCVAVPPPHKQHMLSDEKSESSYPPHQLITYVAHV